MRWAFWRRDRSRERADPLSAVAHPGATTPQTPGRSSEPDEEGRPTPGFSGASPLPGSDARDLLGEGGDDLGGLLSVASDDPALDIAGVRADVVALVEAALARDRAAAVEVLRQLDARGQDETGMAFIAAMAGLGDRLVAAAGIAPGTPAVGAASTAVVAQGDTVAARAEPLLRVVVPHASRDLVRLVVRFACGVPEQDPGLAHLMDAPPEDLALVAAVLLAQTVRDGQADTAALAEELAALLPG